MALRNIARRLQQRTPRASSARAAFSSAGGDDNAEAEFALGVRHFLGRAEAPSARRAVLHWTNAALSGHAKAQSALGQLYLRGHGDVRKDEQLARRFLRQAADAGHESSCHELGKLLLRDSEDGAAAADVDAALRYWTRAAEKGHAAASYDLAFVYERGVHVSADMARAVELYQQAAASGMPEAHRALGSVFLNGREAAGIAQDVDKAVAHLKHAAGTGLALAQFDLGACYMLGRGVARDFQQAAQLFFLAAEGGVPEAQLCLAQLFEQGNGVQPDRAKAVQYYQLAAQSGLSEAKSALDRLGEPHEPPQDKRQ